MFLWADLYGLVLHPFQTLPEIDRHRRLRDGALALGFSISLPALVAELAALEPYRPPASLASVPSLTAQGLDIYSRFVYQQRFAIPLAAALSSLLLWLLAGLVIHAGARALRGAGSLSGMLKLVGFASLTGLIAMPFSLLEIAANLTPSSSAASSLASLTGLVGLGVFLWQNFLLVLAVETHYGLSMGRAVTAVLGPVGCLLLLGLVLLVLAVAVTVLLRPSVGP